VQVVTARVRQRNDVAVTVGAGLGGGVGQAGVLRHREGVDVGAEQRRGALAVGQHADYAAADLLDVVAEALQPSGDLGGRLGFHHAQFGVLVEADVEFLLPGVGALQIVQDVGGGHSGRTPSGGGTRTVIAKTKRDGVDGQRAVTDLGIRALLRGVVTRPEVARSTTATNSASCLAFVHIRERSLPQTIVFPSNGKGVGQACFRPRKIGRLCRLCRAFGPILQAST